MSTDFPLSLPGHSYKPNRNQPPASSKQLDTPNRLESIRNCLQKQGFPPDVVRLLLAATRKNSDAAYQSSWALWRDWCLRRDADPLSVGIAEILKFLSESFSEGKSYRTLNIQRSILSSTLNFAPSGLKDVAFTNSTVPKDRNVAGSNHYPEMFRAYLHPKTVSALHKISVRSSTDNRAICPVNCLEQYLEATRPHRNKDNESQLFIGANKPHRSVSSSTVGRWIKDQLKEAGIDTAIFSAHSVRGAASSKAAAARGPIQSILNQGHWASESNFAKFFRREKTKEKQIDIAALLQVLEDDSD
ncbi:Uncharacterized protein APZ42_026185 [Daphnia magna]|uniref:Tyr recombinase domain-containing protein n=1 Tax=Daphnia magna TaxID=35525 RepID=A0A162DBJ9_9CRUS|nr:Uncharacterized protein APZ42_026185 [Daphnia magna]